MKGILIFLASLILLKAELAYSQANLLVRLPTATIDALTIRDQPRLFDLSVVNEGNTQSQPFRLKLWLSIDNDFTESDLPTIYSSSDVLGPCVSSSCPFERFVREFRFPYPDIVVPADERLAGDTRTPEQWIGESVYVKACISENDGPFIKCQESSYATRIPNIDVQTAMGSTDLLDSIELTWEALPFSLEQTNVEISFAFFEQNSVDSLPSRSLRIPLNELETFVDDFGIKHRKATITDAVAGVSYTYLPASCYVSNSGEEVCQSASSFLSGLRYGQFFASRGTEREGVRVEWQEFSKSTGGYRLERCRKFGECVSIIVPNPVDTYLDTEVEPAEEYRYTISTCSGFDPLAPDPSQCDSNSIETGSTGFGFSDIRDAFENDNSPALATGVTKSVSQSRTFHTPNDVDWLRLVIPTAQSITIATSGDSSADTQVTLYDESGTTVIDESNNTAGVNTSFATLVTDEIPAGAYLLKVNQNFIPGLSETLAVYQLDILIEGDTPVILAPIINLLLNEQP